ncbi:MAG: type IV secretory system conjugative DNA transfer family protein [Christensenellaceae bacterium]|jgi:type IV secretion system protein VirD4|nr:type IV secretory system conjugative DNA transfer family protein [Christensenellaceae bacterium]
MFEDKSFGEKVGMYLFIILGGFIGLFLVLVVGINSFSDTASGLFDISNAIASPFFSGLLICVPLLVLCLFLNKFLDVGDGRKKGGGDGKQFYSNRWMTPKERDTVHYFTRLSQIKEMQKTGALVRFEAQNSDVNVNMVKKDYHTIVLGTTGSGKTQGYVLPYVYTLGNSGEKPNMIITDPKGEIYYHMAATLRGQGYDVQVFNLSDPTKSSRWNPFENAWNMFQRAQNIHKEIIRHADEDPRSLKLRLIVSTYPSEWFEFNKIAFPTFEMAENEMRTFRQKLLSDSEADIKDICAAICPIENDRDPSWEQGARDLIQGIALAMLEDSLNPMLGMTREKFNFYNIYKMLSLRDNDPQAVFKTIKNYFEGRDKLSPAATLAQTVTTNAENTMKNFFGVATQKLSMFADKGICYITSGTEVTFDNFVKKPTAFFLIIPDQIKIRHTLATLCVGQLYKSLVNLANDAGGKLPWPTYFILDEFGNMPKLNDFSTIITVSRSRRVFLTLVLQDYKQLDAVYGEQAAITIRNNCNTQIFIGVNDMDTRKMFSDLLGEMEITTESESISKNTGKAAKEDSDGGSKSRSYSSVSRPLLPPNELLDLKPGNIFVYCFGYHPLRSNVTYFHECIRRGAVRLLPVSEEYVAGKYFDEAAIYYDMRRRNDIVIRNIRAEEKKDMFGF